MTAVEVRDDLFLGDIDDFAYSRDDYDHVLSLCALSPELEDEPDCHIELWDGENEQSLFDEAVDTAIEMIEADGSVLIHCAAGQSRSVSVICTALASMEGTTFEDIRQEIWRKKQSIAPHPELRKLAKEYLGEDGSVYKNPF